MDLDHGHYVVSPDELHERLSEVQLSSQLPDGELLPSRYLPPELNLTEAHRYQNQRPRLAHFGFAVTHDVMLDYALSWYQGRFTRENLKDVDPYLVGTISVGATKKHLEIDQTRSRLNFPMVETPDGLRPCIALYDNYEMEYWDMDAEQEAEFIAFIKSELKLPETQKPMWYYSNCR